MCSRMCEIVLLFIVIWSGICAGKVLIISMDGFRWDYISQTSTPNFDAFEARGTRAPFIQSAFITKTFPCHYSIATGKLFKTNYYCMSAKFNIINGVISKYRVCISFRIC